MAIVKRLNNKHPLYKKVEKLEYFMRELGISVEYTHNGYVLTDTETDVKVFYKDLEATSYDHGVYSIPHFAETKLILIEEE